MRLLLAAALALAEEFDYRPGAFAPDKWPALFPGACDGVAQSPIDIDARAALFRPDYFNAFTFTNYDTP